MPSFDDYHRVISETIPCPRCGNVRAINVSCLDLSPICGVVEIKGWCGCCTVPEIQPITERGVLDTIRVAEIPTPINMRIALDVLHRGFILEVEQEQQDSNQEGDNMIFVVTEGIDNDFCIVSVFDNRIAAISMRDRVRSGDIVRIEVENQPSNGRPWDVFLLTTQEHKPVVAYMDKREAMDKAKADQLLVCRYPVTRGCMEWAEISGYKYFVRLREGERSECLDCGNCYDRKRAYAGEQMAYKVTHRRRYNSSLPHRLEVVGHDRRVAKTLADQMAEIPYDEVMERFEYNVDYVYTQNEQGEWERSECYDVVEALD